MVPVITNKYPKASWIIAKDNSQTDIPINPRFSEFGEKIRDNVANPWMGTLAHRKKEGRTLYRQCIAHEEEHRKPAKAKDLVVLVHPFFTPLSNAEWLNGNIRAEADNYLVKIQQLIDQLPRDKADLVVFETTYHYAAATSFILERGEINGVLFTESNKGSLIRSSDLTKRFNPKRIFVAGAYAEKCLGASVVELVSAFPYVDAIALKDLIVSPPEEAVSIVPDKASIQKTFGTMPPTMGVSDLLYLLS